MNHCGRFGNTHSLRLCVVCLGMSMDVVINGGKSVRGVSMSDKILCPWCGTEMEIKTVEHHGADSFLYPEEGRKPLWNAWTNCLNYNCGAEGPIVVEFESEQEAIKAARAAAMYRYTPPLKPMTFEEVERLAYSASLDDEMPLYLEDVEGDNEWEISYRLRRLCFNAKNEYGKTWRCWSRKPTYVERRRAEWEK